MEFVDALKQLWPHGDQHVPGLLEGTIATAPTVFQKYGLTSNLVIAHAMAQFSEECGAGLEMVENMNYSAEGLLRTFPTHFTGSMAERYAHNPRMIADIAYGGRMGNRPPPSDDGWNWRGHGFAQTTGHDGYAALAKTTSLDLLNHPELTIDPQHALEWGVADFIQCGCLPWAQKDDVLSVTRHLNGGTNGLADRITWLKRWKALMLP